MKISPRGAYKRRTANLLSRALLAFAIGWYVTFNGQTSVVEESDKIGNLLTIENEQHTTPQETNNDFPRQAIPQQLHFPGYPLTRESMKQTGAALGRSAVPKFQDKQWCQPRPQLSTQFMKTNAESEGLFYVKTPKTGSQSINRILKRFANRHSNLPCHFRGHHIQGNPAAWYSQRNRNKSVLLTSLRDPAPRALSRIYWTLSTRQFKGELGVDVLQQSLKRTDVETGCVSEGQGGFELNYVSFPVIEKGSAWNPNQPELVQNASRIHEHVRQVLEDYDFILVQERLEESLVALQLLMGLETADILSMPLHVGGSYLYDRHAGCLELFSPPRLPHLHPNQPNDTNSSHVIEYLDSYFQSPSWYAQNYGDYVLLGAAEATLDQTIQDLGPRFYMELQKFRDLQQIVLDVCSQKVVFPCSKNGTIQREDYSLGNPKAAGDRYPQMDIEACIDDVVKAQQSG